MILRRGAWRAPDELHEALVRSSAESERLSVEWLRSYVLAELDGSLGTVCVFDAPSPEAVRLHAYRAGMPVDEIVAVADTVVGNDAAVAGSDRRSGGETYGEGGSGWT
ncbi:MAG TPA: nickel-binding protein [Gaiellaceae bacterium]|nr:nickel-binding protein [Gaiellaceae bacterium]